MSAVVGVDLSTHALDLVKLSEDSNAATWTRCELVGKTAWERTLSVREALAMLAARPVRAGHLPKRHLERRGLAAGEPQSPPFSDATLSNRVVASSLDNLPDQSKVGAIETAGGHFDPVTDVEKHHHVVGLSADESYAACGICGNVWGCDCGSSANNYWDDVYLVAIEAPYGRGSRGISTLNRVVGAVVASLPAALLVPERCWLVSPGEWKAGLGLKGKPTWDDLPDNQVIYSVVGIKDTDLWQNARDAYCLAYWARETNARAVAQTLEAAT